MFKVRTKSNTTVISFASCSSYLLPLEQLSLLLGPSTQPWVLCRDVAVFACFYKLTKLFEIDVPSLMSGALVFLSGFLLAPDFLLFGIFHCQFSNSSSFIIISYSHLDLCFCDSAHKLTFSIDPTPLKLQLLSRIVTADDIDYHDLQYKKKDDISQLHKYLRTIVADSSAGESIVGLKCQKTPKNVIIFALAHGHFMVERQRNGWLMIATHCMSEGGANQKPSTASLLHHIGLLSDQKPDASHYFTFFSLSFDFLMPRMSFRFFR